MTEFRRLPGAVYIFENREAQRSKVGMTSSNVADRLRDVNDMWLGRKGMCQVCGGRLVIRRERIPSHVVSGIRCPGGMALPFEKDATVAVKYLESLKGRVGELSGTEKGSVVRRIKRIERRLALRLDASVGAWQLSATFYTECPEDVEALSHEILAERLDVAAPFGEVFRCSSAEAAEAVERALSQLGLASGAKKEVHV
jgi:hypothetical protein